ncbi:TaqI-like C-terminal specificity domain-containing protein [Myroides sp. LoEW2-1]|uniref:TaqI-like C-terminal specificity domain-containing protein n=1 Tax=Myroides sp. LoEW2-1 TaxID=2683192 RepID=UPI0013262529|nr:TaqI-like C-terminal specificity domain-containing protein [Myroides sp. LoEW2-1]MVX34362.1 class I SAM-dependent DNA methyltransferase [Myroides sp. LoEW2-1]
MSIYFEQYAHETDFKTSESWVVLSPIEKQIKKKIEAVGTPLKEWDININYGIKTGFNEAFIITGEKRKELIEEDPKSAEIIRPILRGRDIKKYSNEFADLWLIFVPWHFPLHNDKSIKGASEVAEDEFKRQYPAIYNHLSNFKQDLSNRNKAETGIRYEWYALQRWGANYWEDFYSQKIVWKRVGSILRFSFDDKGAFALDSTCFATGGIYIKYLVMILNSKFGKYLMKDSPKTGTGDLLISVQAIEPLQIPIPNKSDLEKIEKIFENILSADQEKTIVSYELEANFLIYKILNFTQEEIDFIEAQ